MILQYIVSGWRKKKEIEERRKRKRKRELAYSDKVSLKW